MLACLEQNGTTKKRGILQEKSKNQKMTNSPEILKKIAS